MPKFKPKDLVRVHTQPTGQYVILDDYSGFIEEIKGNKALFHALLPSEGCGSVPLNCLEHSSDPELIKKKKEYSNRIAKVEKNLLSYKKLDEIAKFGLTKDKLMEIYRAVENARETRSL